MNNDRDNRADQLNPNNPAYWSSRGYSSHPRGPDYGDDDDDPNHPHNLNPRQPGIGFSGLPKHRTPVSCLPKEMQPRAEQFRIEFLKIAENVIKPEMDKYVSRLAALNIQSEAKNTALAEYGQPQGWPFVELTFRREQEVRHVTEYHVEFFCIHSALSVEVNLGTYTGFRNTITYTIRLDEITPVRVSKIINSTVLSAFEHLYYRYFKKTENGREWMVKEINDLESFTPKREP